MYIVQLLLVATCILGPAYSLQSLPLTLAPKVISQGDGLCSTNLVRESAQDDIRTSVRAILQTSVQRPIEQCGEGLWYRIGFLNMSDTAMECPSPWREYAESNVRACGRPITTSASCPSTIYTVNNIQFSKVCGRIIGYQHASPGAFRLVGQQLAQTVDDYYVDGISLTHGNPRSHIWTFAAGASDGNHEYVCPCTSTTAHPSPSFIGNNYFCETAYHSSHYSLDFFPDDPLWDGQGCRRGNCCTFNSPPWFSVELDVPTTDDIEVRICGDQDTTDEDTPIKLLELYIQ